MASPLLTHALALGIGAALAYAALGQGRGTLTTARAAADVNGRPAESASRRAERLVAEVLKPAFDTGELVAAAAAFADADSARSALQADGLEAARRGGAFLGWFRDDPQAALGYFAQHAADPELLAALEIGAAELPPRELLTLAAAGPFRQLGLDGYAAAALARLDPPEAAAAIRDAGYPVTEADITRFAASWPSDQPDGFIDLALALDPMSWLRAGLFGPGPPRRASDLLRRIEARNDIPAGILESIPDGLRAHLYRYGDPSLPIEERIVNMRPLYQGDDEARRVVALKQISTVDINELMKTGPDYRYAFRHGAMSAEEILEAVRRDLPQMAEASDFETRVRVFNELASEDAGAASVLLAGLADDERILAVLHQARWSFRDNAPDTFASMIGLAPGPDTEQAARDRADAWQNYNRGAYGEYGDAYLDWVRELPAGVDRVAARSTLATILRQRDEPELAAEFESSDR